MTSAFESLIELSERARSNALPIPLESDQSPRQSGIGFSLLGRRFVAPMGHIAEMLEVPASTRLPGVQPWVIGLANVRGRLLPLFDLAKFFGASALGQRRQQRVLVLDTDYLYSGLVVDQAFGMQHFTRDLYQADIDNVPPALADFVRGGYVDSSGVSWALFDMRAIASYPRFLNAAL